MAKLIYTPPLDEHPTFLVGRREVESARSVTTATFDAALVSNRGRNYRDFNEDAAFVLTSEDGDVYAAVFDQAGGLGGRVRGEGSAAAARAVFEAFEGLDVSGDAGACLVSALERAHSRLRDRGEREVATAVVVVARGDTATVAHLGDSGAIRFDASGAVRDRTAAHRFYTLQGQSDLTHALGRADWRPPDIARWTLTDGDWIVLGSDGLLDTLSEGEIAAELREAPSAQEAVDRLARRALDAMSRPKSRGDNLSIVALRRSVVAQDAHDEPR